MEKEKQKSQTCLDFIKQHFLSGRQNAGKDQYEKRRDDKWQEAIKKSPEERWEEFMQILQS